MKMAKPGKIFKCEYVASLTGTLNRHVSAVHEKLQNFKCNRCEYATGQASNLKRHVLAVHEKVKNYKCEECQYAASRAITLRQHVLSVHEKVRRGDNRQRPPPSGCRAMPGRGSSSRPRIWIGQKKYD